MKINFNLLKDIECELGDSWYFVDTEKFNNNYHDFLAAFREIYTNTEIAYSYKTNYIPQLCKIVRDNGGFAEVVSEMEYDLAIRVGVDPSRIIVNGPYKPEKSLKKYLLNGSIVNLDSFSEVESLRKILEMHPDMIFNIGLRCNFQFSGTELSRFGFDVEDIKFINLIHELQGVDNLILINLHCHFPNRDLGLFGERTDKMLSLYRRLFQNRNPLWIDLGGGLGGKLDDFLKKQLSYDVAEYQDYAKLIATKFRNEFLNEINKPLLILEPGTALVADTMKFVCKVIDIKKIRNKFIAIVSGSKVNFHPMASKINAPVKIFGDPKIKKVYFDSIDISGYTCMEGDYLFKDYSGELTIGDYLVFENVGSYSIVFKPPFILPNVPIIDFKNGNINVLKNAENFDYIFQTYNFDNQLS